MEDEPAAIPAGLVITPETVSARSFTAAFRGYHPVEVRQFLKRVGDELAAAAGREVELRRALQEALNRAAHPDLDEATVTTVLGEHAARLLASARETAASITDDAQKQADAILRDAEVRVARMRDEAEGLLARRLAEADAATEGIQEAAEAGARIVAEEARAEAERAVEAAKQRGKEMVAEARDLRERMLGDLSRRRRTAQVQVEQLRAARERLLAAYDVVRRTVDEATSELSAAEPEARMAAEAVARRADEADLAPPGRPDESDLPVRRLAPETPAAAVGGDERSLSPVGSRAGRPGAGAGPGPVPAPALLRRLAEPAPPASDRPPMRPQTVADAAGRTLPAPAPAPVEPPPPAPVEPPAPALALPPRPPVEHSELSTMETPAITVDTRPPPPPPNGNGNGNGHGNGNSPVAAQSPASPDTLVDDLFARIRADRATPAPPAEPAAPPAPVAPPTGAPEPAPAPAPDPVFTEDALTARDDLLDNVEAGLTRALKRVLQDEQNELLDRLRRLGSAPAGAADILPEPGPHRAGYRVAALPWLQQAARAGVGSASDPRPGSADENDYPELDRLAEELGAALVEPLRDRLSRVLDDADDPSVAAESVRAAYRQWKVQQVEETARHHVITAFAVGAFAATPDVAVLQWLVDDDGHCPDCDDNALAGPTVKGQPFPTGQLHPPAHPGCRCLLVPAAAVRPPSS